VLNAYGILDTPPERAFDDIVRLVGQLLEAPIVAVNLLAEGRQWFKSEIGLGTREMPLDDSICKFALLQQGRMVVPDTRLDARFNCNPLVTGAPGLRFYAGELLTTPEGVALGTLCVLDLEPRPQGLTAQQEAVLETMAHQVMRLIELHKALSGQQRLLEQQQAIQEELQREREALRDSQAQALAVAGQAERERRRLDALLQAAPVGIIVAEAGGAVVHVNAENRRIWGAHPMSRDIAAYAEWKGWWADGSARHGQRLREDEWAMSRALAGEDAPRHVIEIESFDRPGVRRIMLNSGAPIRNETGEIVGAVVAQMDVTERVKAEEALRQADQKKDEFLAMLAHELRNPLAPITSAAAILSNHAVDVATVRRTSAIIARQAKHMTGLIDDLLDVSRVTRGRVDLTTAELDIKDIIADAIEQVRPLVEKHQHRLLVQLAPAPAIVLGDRKRLVQVMTNLLSNAAKYTPHGGAIDVLLESGYGELAVTVRDNGIGMTPELIADAFELFSQGKRGLDRSQGGLGIGLALVKSLLQLHGGTVSVHSEGPDRGSSFVVRLPAVARSAEAAAGTPALPAGAAPGLLRIGIVDDNEDAAATLSMFLQAYGHEVSIAHCAEHALELLPAFAPDVCLLDIGLPEMSGFELARALRSQPSLRSAVLVAITGYAQEKDRQEARGAGFDDLFAKPVDLGALNTLLTRVAQHRPR
jgi:signal transduction histidine kinase